METYDPQKSTSEVRQGTKQKTNFRVLIISTGLVILAFAVIFIVYTINQPSPT